MTETTSIKYRMQTPEEMLRDMFIDGVLPEVGDVVEQVVTGINLASGYVTTKLRVVRKPQ